MIFLFIFIILYNSWSNVLACSGIEDNDQGYECKVIIAMNPATAGEYNLHMKVRDPSRGGGQVLFILEPGYNYTYHHPITGEEKNFSVTHKIIGTASAGDIPPSILKPGMVLTSAGISFGDADNPTLEHLNKNVSAWDDFDWMRYAFQTADSEEEAVRLLTKVAVDELHATSIGETLFVVGPNSGYAIEADSDHYYIHEIEDVYVKSNYPEFLWEPCSYFKDIYAPTFETKFDGWVVENQTVKLGEDCSRGVTIYNISSNYIVARQYPDDGINVTINMGENKSVYNFRVGLLDCETESGNGQALDKKAHITVCYKYLEWREKLYELVNTRRGNITIQDIMRWSRLHESDLDGLRGFCEGSETRQEVVNIFKHPLDKPELMSSVWFAGIPCCSVYVPVHNSVDELYNLYLTGDAWNITLRLLQNYSHGELTPVLEGIEEVFVNETEKIENICFKLNDTMTESLIELLTVSDYMLQHHAYKMENILLDLAKLNNLNLTNFSEGVRIITERIKNAWEIDYNTSLIGLKNTINEVEKLSEIMNSTSSSEKRELIPLLESIRIKILRIINVASELKYLEAFHLINHTHPDMMEAHFNYQLGLVNISLTNYSAAADNFIRTFQLADNLLQLWPDIPEIPEVNGSDGDGGDGDGGDGDGDGNDDVEDGNGEDEDMKDKDEHPWYQRTYVILTIVILIGVILSAIFKRIFRDKK